MLLDKIFATLNDQEKL
jgi:hypothetical protein